MGCERAAVLVHGLARKEFVRRERSAAVGGEVELAFRHVLVRDVAYAQIPRADRSAKHVTAGIWIEALGRPEDHAELIAHHYVTALELARAAGTQSPELVDRARHALRDAGDRAHALGAYEAAAGHYGRALELWPENERDRALLLFGRARARTWAGDADERELREAAAALLGIGRAELAAEVESLLSQVAWYADDGARSQEHLGRALELVEPLPESASKAWILAEASRLAALATEYDDSLEYGRRALELAEALELPHVRVHTLTSVGNVRAYLGDQDGIRLVEEGVRMARELNSPLLPRCLNNLSVAYGLYGRTREGLEAMQAAIAAGARFGLGPMLRFSRANLIGELYSEGRWDEALHEAQVLLDEAQATGLQAIERMVLGRRALIRLWRGNAAGADADTARALELARKAEEPQAVLPALLGRTIFLSASGRFDEARPLAQELLVRGGDTRLPYPGGADFWYVTQCVDSEEALASLTGRSTWRTPWLDAIEELLRGDPDRAVHQYRKLGARTDEAFARLRAGEVHLAAGRRTEAETHLEHAVEFYRRVRATLYVQQAEALLAEPALGRRPA
jgi:tetratricopeptide (TPR) repeat protein